MKFYTRFNVLFSVSLLCVLFFPLPGTLAQQEEKEDTYSISLVQTAEVDKNIIEIEDKKVLTENYTVERGDHLWQLLRERGLLKKRKLPEVLAMLKKLNKSLTNLDLIHPGEKIIIPLTISPVKGMPKSMGKVVETIPVEKLKDMDLENYTVKSGDRLVKVIRERYDMPEKHLYRDYLKLVKKLNPSIEDLNRIYPGQIVRLPIYSPQIVRIPIKPPSPPEPEKKEAQQDLGALSRQLGEIINQMGEEWVQTGQHFIPLKSGGQINLEAETYPIINLSNGSRVIVDIYHVLPDEMGRLIVSSWENYKIVHLAIDDTLSSALGKILQVCGYDKIYNPGEPLELGGDFQIEITADWIVKSAAGGPAGKDNVLVITLTDSRDSETPHEIKDYLKTLGIVSIDYPQMDKQGEEPGHKVEILRAGRDRSELVGMLLNLSGQPFETNMEIPIYEEGGSAYNLIIKADFFMKINGRNSIIDLTGMSPDVLSILKERHFLVMSLHDENDPSLIVSKTLDFIGVKSDSKPHLFMAADRKNSKNIRITIPGITFHDNEGLAIFATHLSLPGDVANFLSRKGYTVLSLTPS